MYPLHRYLLIISLCLVISSRNQLKARNDDRKVILMGNVYRDDNLVIDGDSSELTFDGSRNYHSGYHNLGSSISSFNLIGSSQSVPSSSSSSSLPPSASASKSSSSSSSSLQTSPTNYASKLSHSPTSIPSTFSLSSSSPSTTINDQKSDDNGGVDSKFYTTLCSSNRLQSCQDLPIDCVDCEYDYNCDFGEVKSVTCRVKEMAECQGPKLVHHNYTCAYCYQLPETNYYCMSSFACRINSRYLTDCSMKPNVLCLGNRSFQRYKTCNFVSGYKWSTALLLSVTLGGFGIDRFYLGYWQEGIGKLFSFGGFGVWTLVDIILISTGYLKPADGSRYINDFSLS